MWREERTRIRERECLVSREKGKQKKALNRREGEKEKKNKDGKRIKKRGRTRRESSCLSVDSLLLKLPQNDTAPSPTWDGATLCDFDSRQSPSISSVLWVCVVQQHPVMSSVLGI